MKKLIIIFYFLPCISSIAQPGYEIRVTLKPYRDVYIYLGHYFGKQYPIIDSAKLDANNTAVFKGDKKLPGGIYLIGFPNRSGFFEVLVDKQQHFSIIADTASIKNGVKFINSPDNVLFNSYQQYMSVKGKEIAVARQQYSNAKNASDSAHWNDELNKTDKIIREYRTSIGGVVDCIAAEAFIEIRTGGHTFSYITTISSEIGIIIHVSPPYITGAIAGLITQRGTGLGV